MQLLIEFQEYAEFAEAEFQRERYGLFVRHGQMLKRHPPATWRPIKWCDRCKIDITDGLYFDEATKTALCPACANGGDKAAAAALGIIWDG